jgi:hypothetical protein
VSAKRGIDSAAETDIARSTFRVLEGHRLALAERLQDGEHRRERYRDLVLMRKVIRLERDHIAARTSESPDGRDDDALGAPESETLAAWARPWGHTRLVELHADYNRYTEREYRLRRWLSRRARERAEVEAGRRFQAIRQQVAKRPASKPRKRPAPKPR